MVNVKKTDQDIAELTKQLKQLEAQREKEAEKAVAVKQLVKSLKADLRANKLTVDDLLEALGGSKPAGRAKAPAKRGRKAKAATRKAKKTGTKITIPDLGTYKIASRGRLPAELAAFVEQSGLSRAELIEQYKG